MKIYDLSCTLEKGLWYYGAPYTQYNVQTLATLGKNGYITNEHKLTSHTGTHIEGGRHWWNDVPGIDQEDLNHFAGKAKVFKFKSEGRAFFEINKNTLIEAGAEKLEKGDICIIGTEWDKQIKADNYTTESPYITVDAAEFLAEKGIKLMATDFPMCGDPRDGMDFVPQDLVLPDYILLKNDIPYLLGMVGVDKLPDEVIFVGAPLKLKDADGSPVRAFAIELQEADI